MRRALALATWLLSSANLALALDPHRAVTQYTYDHWTPREGLPHLWVTSVLQTRDGYLWLGTSMGLARFDGVSYRLFDPTNTPALKSRNVLALHECRDGALWVATYGGGVTRLAPGRSAAFTTAEGLAGDLVNAMVEDAAGTIWAVTNYAILNRFDPAAGRFVALGEAEGFTGDPIWSVQKGPDGSLWIRTSRELRRYKDGRFVPFTFERHGLRPQDQGSFLWDREGALWVVVEGGLRRFKDGRAETFRAPPGALPTPTTLWLQPHPDYYAPQLHEDRDGNLWIARYAFGLTRFRDGVFAPLTAAQGLRDTKVAALAEDREGNLWVAFKGGGLGRLKDGPFTAYASEEGLPSLAETPASVFEDRDGALWIDNVRYSEGRFETFPGVRPPVVQGLDGSLYWGGQGLVRMRGGRLEPVRFPQADILALHVDRGGHLWVGTRGRGLYQLRDGRLLHYTTRDGLGGNNVLAIAEDARGGLWLATNGGVSRLAEGKLRTLRRADGLSSEDVQSLYLDREGVLWIGTNGGGLNRLRGESVRAFTTREGLFDDVAFAIVEDDRERLWIGSERGVFSVAKAELAAVEAGRASRVSSRAYGLGDGMKSIAVTGHVQRGACRARDGRIWFATVRGVAVVDPNALRRNELAPPVIIEDVLLFGERPTASASAPSERVRAPIRRLQPQPAGEPVVLEPGQNEVEIYYTALSYRDTEKVRFKYRLEGLDDDWVDPGPRRVAYYPRIPSGRYRFRVIASNNDGVWNEQGASFAFRVKPRFHETPLFWGLCLAGGALLLWQGVRFRIRRMEDEHRAVLAERGRLARELHDTLLQGISGIVFQLEAIAKRVALEQPVRARLEQVLEQARGIADDTRRSVHGLRSTAVDRSDLGAALAQLGAAGGDGEPAVTVDVSGQVRPVPESVARNVAKIAQEAVANARKHAGASRILVRASFTEGTLELRVCDDGPGLGPAVDGRPHFGLLTMRERATELGGVLKVRSLDGQGTEVGVTVPLP